jgi:hypothetical protein
MKTFESKISLIFLTLIIVILFGCNTEVKKSNVQMNIDNEILQKPIDSILLVKYDTFDFDTAITNFISKTSKYSLLTKIESLPENVKPFIEDILEYFSYGSNSEYIYYVDIEGIKVAQNVLMIPLHSYQGFVKAYQLEKRNEESRKSAKVGEPYTLVSVNGNLGGGGYIEIDLKSKTIIGFGMWC